MFVLKRAKTSKRPRQEDVWNSTSLNFSPFAISLKNVYVLLNTKTNLPALCSAKADCPGGGGWSTRDRSADQLVIKVTDTRKVNTVSSLVWPLFSGHANPVHYRLLQGREGCSVCLLSPTDQLHCRKISLSFKFKSLLFILKPLFLSPSRFPLGPTHLAKHSSFLCTLLHSIPFLFAIYI